MAATPYEEIRENPLDRVDLGFLPGDTNADNSVTLDDYTELENVLAGHIAEDLTLHDINRDGVVTNEDLARLTQLFNGTDTTRAWINYSLPARP